MFKRLLLFVVFIVSYGCVSFASDVINSVIVKGNERIETSTIKTFLQLSEGDKFDQNLIDQSLKKIYASNLFSDVNIFRQNNNLIVEVTENFKINKIFFEGNKKIKDKDLQAEVILKPRMVYTKARLQQDINRITEVYHQSGIYAVKIAPKIVKLPENRIDLIFEINEGPKSKIGKIIFVGNEQFSSLRLSSVISSQETRWYNILTSSDNFHPGRIEFDKELLSKFYKSKGFADFQIVSVISELTPKKDRFIVTFTIEEGKKYNFGEISVENNIKNVDSSIFNQDIYSKTNSQYNISFIEKTIDKITTKLNDNGYAFVQVIPHQTFDHDKNLVNIQYIIQEGKKFYLNKINISGNLRTSEKVIRREFTISEGDPYNASRIKRSERKIMDLDFFDNVDVKTVPTEEVNKFDLDVKVNEKSTASVNFAGGFSTSDGIIAKIGFNETNLFGNGQNLSVDLMKTKKNIDIDLSFTEPYFMDMPLAVGFDLYSFKTGKNTNINRSYSQTRRGVSLRMGYHLTENLTHTIRYNFQKTNVSDIDKDSSPIIKEQEGKRNKSSIANTLAYDRRNSSINPTQGYYISLRQELAGIGGNTKYLKHDISGRYYVPIFKEDIILRLFADAGYIKGLGNNKVHLNDRYFIGGEDLRGFEYSGIGARTKDGKHSLGGNVYYTASAEVKFPLGMQKELGLHGLLFVDAGNLYKIDSTKNIDKNIYNDKNSIRISAGVGVGFITPMGPINLSYGMPLKKEKFDQTRKFLISFQTKF